LTLGRWVGLISLLISLYVLWQVRLIVLFFMPVIFSTGLNRVVRQFQKSKLKRGVVIALTVVIALMILGLVLILVANRIMEQVDQLIDLIPGAIAQVATFNYWIQEQIPGLIINNLPSLSDLSLQLQRVANWAIIHFYQIFSNSLFLLLNSLLLTVLTLMLLANPKQYRNLLIQGFPAFYRRRADSILSKCEVGLVNYLSGIALSMAFTGIASTIGLLVLQVPLSFVNGLIADITAFVPYLSAIASVVPPALLALLESMAGITPRTSLLDPCIKLSPYTAPDSIRRLPLPMCK